MEKNTENLKVMLNFKSGDEIWACMRFPVFSTENGYFGHFFWGDNYNPYEIHCIEGKSPTAFKPQKIFYEGRFDAVGSSSNVLFVFASCKNPTSGYDRFVLPLYYEGYKPPELEIDARTFANIIDDKRLLRFDRIHFTEEECLKKCRELNSSWHWCSGIGAYGKWYMKTLNKMKKELSECMRAEWVVDPVEQVKKDLAGGEQC